MGCDQTSTLTSHLTIEAKSGIMNLQRIIEGFDTGKWYIINMIAESCNDDSIVNQIKEYHMKNKKEE